MTEQLPVLWFEKTIVETVARNPATVIQADTGAGKTSQVPLMLLAAGFGRKGMIGVTQPRRIAAVSMTEYVSQLHGTESGDVIGYQIKGERKTSRATRLKFMTEGILLRELHADPELRRYEVIVVDEAHERGINQDLLIALLKRVQHVRPDLKVVIMSATIDATKFSKHFDNALVITIPGRLFPVEVRYAAETPLGMRELVEACADTVVRIVRSGERGDILAFLPDEKSIHSVEHALERAQLSGVRVLPLYGNQDVAAQRAVFARTPLRRVILATNIAETSITIDGVVHVIDSGLIKQEHYVNASMSALIVTEHSKAGCRQREGRAGRTQPGICHRLYRREDFEDRSDFTEPEIRRTALDQVLLQLRVLGYTLDAVKKLEFMDPPGNGRWDEAEARLRALGATDAKGAVTTDGERMQQLPVAPMLGRMILEGERRKCLKEIVTIVAGFSARPVFLKAKSRDEQGAYDAVQQCFRDPTSDALTLLKVWTAWGAAIHAGRQIEWAKSHRMFTRALREIDRDREHLVEVLDRLSMEPTSNSDPIEIRKAVAAGLMTNLCVARGMHRYAWHDREDIFVHPGSAVFGNGPRLMVCAEIVETTKAFARNCTTVEESWITELVPADALGRTWRIEPAISEHADASVTETLSWQEMMLSSRTITEFPPEAIPVIVSSLLSEVVTTYREIRHPHTEENRVVWRTIAETLGIEPMWRIDPTTLEACPARTRMAAFFLRQVEGARTLMDVRERDLRLQLEDYITPEHAAEHRERVAAEQVRAEAARVAREGELQREREEREANQRERAEKIGPLTERVADLQRRIVGLDGDKAERLRHSIGRTQYQLGYEWMHITELERAIDALEATAATIEGAQHDKIALSELAWRSVIETFPVCPLCDGTWQVSNSCMLQCTVPHDPHRIITGSPVSRVGDIGRFRTDRDEDVAWVRVNSMGAALVFVGARMHAWNGKKFKVVRFEPSAIILPPELASQHSAIANDLKEYRQAQRDLEAIRKQVREASVGGVVVKRLTFRIKGGQAFASNGVGEYRAAYQDPYPADGETWFCRVGAELGGRVHEAHPLFKAGTISCDHDLEDLRALIREVYPGLPEYALQ